MSRTLRLCVAAAGAFGVVTALAIAAPQNGNFEKGTFKGWKTEDSGGDLLTRSNSKGVWQVYKGKLKVGGGPTPRGGIESATLAEPPQGTYAAGLSTLNPGSHILHRKLSVSGKRKLTFQLAFKNTAEDFYAPDTLAYEEPRRGVEGFKNQQLRIDVMVPAAPIDSLEDADIAKTIFHTEPGDKRKQGWKKIKANLQKGEYRLRIAEVDNQSPFLVGVDAVKLKKK